MQIAKNVSLKSYNTFGIDVHAEQFAKIESVEALQNLCSPTLPAPVFILGGGSNILLTQPLQQLVLWNAIKGKQVIEKEGNDVILAVGGGENWHELVLWCVENGLGGAENLSLIPGTVGAAPIQNIGAYGVELKDVFERLEAVELTTGIVKTFSKADCHFGYRDSVFKHTLKGKYFITKVYFRLQRFEHRINTSYGAIAKTLTAQGIEQPTIKDVSEAVIAIRQSKLPDPKILGNSGSFFKNPTIDHSHFEQLRAQFPDVVAYNLPDGRVKIPAGWLIDQCGWKGKRVGNTGAYEKQALVLVNYGGATGAEVWALAQRIASTVQEKYGILLTPEVNVI